ncbi:hypothetical protein C2845_PM02G08450 [Panicum miliaceum]|uniref:Uncharacterized protein n=1 Tax=Panicum miliaceum TaxID=4540 RepID=A0A3L6S4C6_PANMI|nr:hypothetical protein C2845_PM02G08450 [Panicum miliaceum]
MPSKECHMAKGKSVRCLKLMGSWEKVPGVEADDVIGTLAVNSVSAGYKVCST